MTQGRRVYFSTENADGRGQGKFLPRDLKLGDYWRDEDTGVWMAYCIRGGIGSLANHDVTEHEDGTITVSPSILITGGQNNDSWHGYLEHGVWREV